ncbi:hypothetical protein ACFVZH_36990 [Streptomyces sp. NPDC059534]|uniref:hypothetical protein n=1 Tax=Streptomyces sp. NPDC059534 TaxID=3346859 RepID=UPI0036B9414E
MTFNDHLQHLVERALASIPAADASDIYAVSFLIGNEDDDPRQPTLTIGYNTETQAQRSIQDTSDQAEARWNYAFWIQNELTVVGDLAWCRRTALAGSGKNFVAEDHLGDMVSRSA